MKISNANDVKKIERPVTCKYRHPLRILTDYENKQFEVKYWKIRLDEKNKVLHLRNSV